MKILIKTMLVGCACTVMAQDEPMKKKERPSREKLFSKLDANKDGFIGVEEFKLPAHRGALVTDEVKKKAFTKIDKDADGKISKEEFVSKKKAKKPKKDSE